MSASDYGAAPIPGRVFSAQTSQRRNATLSRDGNCLVITDDLGHRAASAELGETEVEPRLGSAPQKLTFPNGVVFETTRQAQFDRMIGHQRHALLHRFEAFRPRLIFFVIGAIVAAGLVYRFGLALLVNIAVAVTPQPIVDAIDTGTMRTLDLVMANESTLSETEQGRIAEIFEGLVATLPPEKAVDHDFRLEIRSAPLLGPNAAALPGGTVIVTDALPEFLDADTDALAGVLAHEIGHVVEQHGLKQVYRSAGLFVLVSFLAGDTGPMLEDVLLEGNLLLSLSYSREHELEADAFAVQLMQEAGYEPEQLAGFFERIAEMMPENAPWYSTHPGSDNRAEIIRDLSRD